MTPPRHLSLVSSASPLVARPSWDPLVDWPAKKTTREGAVSEIARRYGQWVDIFEKARAS